MHHTALCMRAYFEDLDRRPSLPDLPTLGNAGYRQTLVYSRQTTVHE
jgi:hypothetical protein